MPLIFVQHLVHHKMEAHVCLVFGSGSVNKMEVFETILLLLFHSKTHFFMVYISF